MGAPPELGPRGARGKPEERGKPGGGRRGLRRTHERTEGMHAGQREPELEGEAEAEVDGDDNARSFAFTNVQTVVFRSEVPRVRE